MAVLRLAGWLPGPAGHHGPERHPRRQGGGEQRIGADPYWYLFYLHVPGPCGYLGPTPPSQAPGVAVTAGDTLQIEFAVTCSSESPWDYAELGSKVAEAHV